MTIDGFVGEAGGDPAWPVAYYDDELAAYEAELLSRAGSTPWVAGRTRT